MDDSNKLEGSGNQPLNQSNNPQPVGGSNLQTPTVNNFQSRSDTTELLKLPKSGELRVQQTGLPANVTPVSDSATHWILLTVGLFVLYLAIIFVVKKFVKKAKKSKRSNPAKSGSAASTAAKPGRKRSKLSRRQRRQK